jgi:hypothetical protein
LTAARRADAGHAQTVLQALGEAGRALLSTLFNVIMEENGVARLVAAEQRDQADR